MKRILQSLLLTASLLVPTVAAQPFVVSADGGSSQFTYLTQKDIAAYPWLDDSTVDYGACACPRPSQPSAFQPVETVISASERNWLASEFTPKCTVAGSESALDNEEQQFISLLNSYRAQNGRAALTSNDLLNRSAAWMSNDMATRGFAPSDHVDTLGRPIAKRIDDCGFTGAREVRENIYYASPPSSSGAHAQGALTGWQNLCDADASGACTYAHRTTMLATDVTMVGVAHVCTASTCYWTLDLGNR